MLDHLGLSDYASFGPDDEAGGSAGAWPSTLDRGQSAGYSSFPLLKAC